MADWRKHLIDDDAGLGRLLAAARTVAVIGYKVAAHEAAHRIPSYLVQQGYRVIGVSPKVSFALGGPAYARVLEVPEAVDLVNVFRAADNLPPHVDEILAMKALPAAVWLQLGIRHDAQAERLARAGIDVVQDRCIMVDHQRLASKLPKSVAR